MRYRTPYTILSIMLLFSLSTFGQTLSLEKKAEKFIAELKPNNYPFDGKDTLIDLNGDHFKDILIEYYGSAGTGLKNRIIVYLYDTIHRKFKSCEQLDYLANPTFYFTKKTVVGYYVGGGGGHATKLKWHGSRLDTLEYIDIDINFSKEVNPVQLNTYNYLTKKRTESLLQEMRLPKEYNYGNYTPIIKNNSR